MVDTEKLFKLKQELADFLREHPELCEFQLKIEAELKKCGNNHNNRISVLSQLMRDKLKELGDACKGLVSTTKTITDDYKHQ